MWTGILRWLLPSIPEIISTVRDMKKAQQAASDMPHSDLVSRLEQVENALTRQSQLNKELIDRLQHVQRHLQIATFAAIFAFILAVVGLAVAVFK